MAAQIKQALNADTDMVPGGRGEFSVWVDSKKVAEKSRTGFPSENTIVETVRKALDLSK